MWIDHAISNWPCAFLTPYGSTGQAALLAMSRPSRFVAKAAQESAGGAMIQMLHMIFMVVVDWLVKYYLMMFDMNIITCVVIIVIND